MFTHSVNRVCLLEVYIGTDRLAEDNLSERVERPVITTRMGRVSCQYCVDCSRTFMLPRHVWFPPPPPPPLNCTYSERVLCLTHQHREVKGVHNAGDHKISVTSKGTDPTERLNGLNSLCPSLPRWWKSRRGQSIEVSKRSPCRVSTQ